MKVELCSCNILYIIIIHIIFFLEKSKIENISLTLDKIALQELQELPSYIKECSIRKIPEIGFLLCLPFWKSSNEMDENDYEIQHLEFKVYLTKF